MLFGNNLILEKGKKNNKLIKEVYNTVTHVRHFQRDKMLFSSRKATQQNKNLKTTTQKQTDKRTLSQNNPC